MGEADSIAVQLSVTYLLYTVQDPFSATRQSSFQNNSLPSLCLLVDQVLASQIKAEEETLRVKLTPLWFSCQSPISCTQIKIHSAQQDSPVSETVFTLFYTQLSLSSLCFLVDQVLASQIKAEEENFWVKLTPLQVSYQSPNSCTQFKIRSAQQDSPVSKTVFTLFSFFFQGTKSYILAFKANIFLIPSFSKASEIPAK